MSVGNKAVCHRAPGEHEEAGRWRVGIAAKGLQARGPRQEGDGEEGGKLRGHPPPSLLQDKRKVVKGWGQGWGTGE